MSDDRTAVDGRAHFLRLDRDRLWHVDRRSHNRDPRPDSLARVRRLTRTEPDTGSRPAICNSEVSWTLRPRASGLACPAAAGGAPIPRSCSRPGTCSGPGRVRSRGWTLPRPFSTWAALPATSCRLLSGLAISNLFGIDLNPAVLKMPDANVINYTVGDLLSTPWPDGHFAGISAISVVEHGVPDEELCREVSRLLRPGGIFVFTTDYWPAEDRHHGAHVRPRLAHLRRRPRSKRWLRSRTGTQPSSGIGSGQRDPGHRQPINPFRGQGLHVPLRSLHSRRGLDDCRRASPHDDSIRSHSGRAVLSRSSSSFAATVVISTTPTPPRSATLERMTPYGFSIDRRELDAPRLMQDGTFEPDEVALDAEYLEALRCLR